MNSGMTICRVLVHRHRHVVRTGGLLLSVVTAPLTVFLILNALFPLPVGQLHPVSSQVVVDRHGEILRAFLTPDELWRIRVVADEISPYLKEAVLAYEDRQFFHHFGVNPRSIVRAAIANIRAGRVVQGGSTITMQLARLMEPKERTLTNKIVEAFRAVQLEMHYSKEEILTHYFNMAPYGGNLVGVGAASYLYFNKSPRQLSLGEAALLAAIPNSPNLLRPDMNPEAALKARSKILDVLVKEGRISAPQRTEALSEPIPGKRYAAPFEIPQLSQYLARNHPHHERLESTIETRIQHMAEKVLRTNLTPLRSKGITNGAVVIIDNLSRDVLAMVGSYDFFDEESDGQVNGAMAPRSPGSALKPFIYALGLEEGLISPLSRLSDVPVEYTGYQPANYDGTYHGTVTAQDALVRSLNVPAVNLFAALGEHGIYTFLKKTDISTLPKQKSHYGLSLILGGCEVTLVELTNLYAGLAGVGVFQPYRLLRSEPPAEGTPLLGPGTCYIISDMLSHLRRPELPSVWESSIHLPKVAWKTGTSYGHRDAWSIGYTPRYTIGVWVGNFDGRGVPELVGAEAAAPIMFALFQALSGSAGDRWFVQPENVGLRRVCAVSGMVPGVDCKTTQTELYIVGTSPHQSCTVHRQILIDKKTQTRLCSCCRRGREHDTKIVEVWPPDIATWMERNGYPTDHIPEHYPACPTILSGEKPVIRSPSANTVYKIRPGVERAYQKILLDANVSNETKNIYWFVDGKLVFSGLPTKRVFIEPIPGAHTVMCVDNEGRSSEVRMKVR